MALAALLCGASLAARQAAADDREPGDCTCVVQSTATENLTLTWEILLEPCPLTECVGAHCVKARVYQWDGQDRFDVFTEGDTIILEMEFDPDTNEVWVVLQGTCKKKRPTLPGAR
jgi:hypothetical protein